MMTNKERPILFSAPMIRAILNGTKTQTRRIAKSIGIAQGIGHVCNGSDNIRDWPQFCPYGKPGDRLWVRETFLQDSNGFIYRADGDFEGNSKILGGWMPSIYMPRKASRITLKITNIRVERLQDISWNDAIAEGVYDDGKACVCEQPLDFVRSCGNCGGRLIDAIDLYKQLWESINEKGSWDLNPWVWVIEFKRIDK